jgi:hypothetical protein
MLRPHLHGFAPADRADWERAVRALWDDATQREEWYAAIVRPPSHRSVVAGRTAVICQPAHVDSLGDRLSSRSRREATKHLRTSL